MLKIPLMISPHGGCWGVVTSNELGEEKEKKKERKRLKKRHTYSNGS